MKNGRPCGCASCRGKNNKKRHSIHYNKKRHSASVEAEAFSMSTAAAILSRAESDRIHRGVKARKFGGKTFLKIPSDPNANPQKTANAIRRLRLDVRVVKTKTGHSLYARQGSDFNQFHKKVHPTGVRYLAAYDRRGDFGMRLTGEPVKDGWTLRGRQGRAKRLTDAENKMKQRLWGKQFAKMRRSGMTDDQMWGVFDSIDQTGIGFAGNRDSAMRQMKVVLEQQPDTYKHKSHDRIHEAFHLDPDLLPKSAENDKQQQMIWAAKAHPYSLSDEEVIHQYLTGSDDAAEVTNTTYGGGEELPYPNVMLDEYDYQEIGEILGDPDWYIGDAKFSRNSNVAEEIRKLVSRRGTASTYEKMLNLLDDAGEIDKHFGPNYSPSHEELKAVYDEWQEADNFSWPDFVNVPNTNGDMVRWTILEADEKNLSNTIYTSDEADSKGKYETQSLSMQDVVETYPVQLSKEERTYNYAVAPHSSQIPLESQDKDAKDDDTDFPLNAIGRIYGKFKNPTIGVPRNNLLGTLSLDIKGKGMRKSQNFTFYPKNANDGLPPHVVHIQSETRNGYLDLITGNLISTPPYPGGSYNHHLAYHMGNVMYAEDGKSSMRYLGQLTEEDRVAVVDSFGTSTQKWTEGVVKTDNSGADSMWLRAMKGDDLIE